MLLSDGDRENVLGVGNYCYVASTRRRARRWGAHGGGEGRGHIMSSRAQLVNLSRSEAAQS